MTGLIMIGLGWVGWVGSDWVGLIGLNWVGLDWARLDLAGLG